MNGTAVIPKGSGNLLAISAGTRRTGWSVFAGGGLKKTGVISIPAVLRARPDERSVLVVCSLDEVAVGWDVGAVACRRGSSVGPTAPGTAPLEAALSNWREFRELAWYSYTTAEVRTALAGKPNASGEALSYAVMENLGLIGETRTAEEWEAAAIGVLHLQQTGATLARPEGG